MKILLVGCEYSGTTTLANGIRSWWRKVSGRDIEVRDHFRNRFSSEEFTQYLELGPRVREEIERNHIYAHSPIQEDKETDHILVGLHIEDAVYGPLLFGYGEEGGMGDRKALSQVIDHRFQRLAPETVRILVKASPQVILKRMEGAPHSNRTLKKDDVEEAIVRFEDAAKGAQFRRKFELDTSTSTLEETMTDFVRKMEGHLTEMDRYRILLHRHWSDGSPI